MRDLSNELKETYSNKIARLEYGGKAELYELYEEPKHTGAVKRIVCFYVVLAALICAFAIGAGATCSELAKIIFDKTQNTPLTDEEKQEIVSRLDDMHMPTNGLEDLPDLQTNENGDVYGAWELSAELVAVRGTENTVGYCYNDDMAAIDGTNLQVPVQSYIEAKENGTWRNWVYAYEADGKTVIGKFVYGDNGGFYTNEELQDETVQAVLINGEDIEEYEKTARNRSID